jgi:hypothetical protein
MPEQRDRLTMAGPAAYRVRVQGVIERNWVAQYTSMKVSYRNVGRPDVVTFLTGDVLDQANLLGLLNHLYECGLPLVSVQLQHPKVEQRVQARSRKSGKVNPARTRRTASSKAGVAEG